MNAHAQIGGPAALALSLLLALAPQGGSCGGAGGAAGARGDNRAANAATNRESGMNQGGTTKAGGERGAVARGTWGGRGVRLDVSDAGARVEFDCAHGTTGKLSTDAAGNFDAVGTFVRERGGPVRDDESSEGKPARYSGRVEGKSMTLRVNVEGGDELPAFTLTHGAEARLRKCL